MRPSERLPNQLRDIVITRHYTKHAAGSVLIAYGETKVLCTASIIEGVPRFIKNANKKTGWLTAEYGMLPGATHTRCDREAVRGKQSGRTQEIQRLIARSLRQMIDLKALGEYTIQIDCDVLQADGGTRTASITGGCVALIDAINTLKEQEVLKADPLRQRVAAISVGICDDVPVLDLDYDEDSTAQTDMNIVMNDEGCFIEVQGTAESQAFHPHELNQLLALAQAGINDIFAIQDLVLK